MRLSFLGSGTTKRDRLIQLILCERNVPENIDDAETNGYFVLQIKTEFGTRYEFHHWLKLDKLVKHIRNKYDESLYRGFIYRERINSIVYVADYPKRLDDIIRALKINSDYINNSGNDD